MYNPLHNAPRGLLVMIGRAGDGPSIKVANTPIDSGSIEVAESIGRVRDVASNFADPSRHRCSHRGSPKSCAEAGDSMAIEGARIHEGAIQPVGRGRQFAPEDVAAIPVSLESSVTKSAATSGQATWVTVLP